VKNPFQIGDKKHFRKRVLPEETARFESGEVHPFYGTFALARDAEWSSRLFVLDMKEEDEEGIGTFVEVQHLSPALVGDEVEFTAVLVEQQKNNVIYSIEAKVGERMIAKGRTGQKILKKEKLKQISAQIEAS